MKKVLLAMFVLGLSVTSHAGILLEANRGPAKKMELKLMRITYGAVQVESTNRMYYIDKFVLEQAGISAADMVRILNDHKSSTNNVTISCDLDGNSVSRMHLVFN